MPTRPVPANTIRLEVTDFPKVSSTDRTAATDWITAINAQVAAAGANMKSDQVFKFPPKGTRTLPANMVVLTFTDFANLTSTERTNALTWLTAVTAQLVALGTSAKNHQNFIYPPKG